MTSHDLLREYSRVAQAALCAATLDALVQALAEALEKLRLVDNAGSRRAQTLVGAARLTIQRVACGAGESTDLSGLRRMLRMLGPGGGDESALDAWMTLATAGTARLRAAYLASLLPAARGLHGDNVVAISDFSGQALPVHALGRGDQETVTERVMAQANQLLQSAIRSCRPAGVLGIGRFRMTRLDRPSRTLVDSAADLDRSPTGLPVMIVRAHAVESFDALPEPTPLAVGTARVGIETRMALRVAG